MRTRLAVPTAALVALAALPAGAQTAEPVPCDPPAAGVTVLTVDDRTGTIEAPLLPGDVTEQRFLLDLSPATAIQRAPVSAELSWTLPANDFDLAILDANGGTLATSEGFQPLDPTVESASAGKLAHCTEFAIQAVNFNAAGVPAPVDTLNLVVTVGKVA